MSYLFISCGGSLEYTSQLSNYMRIHHLYANTDWVYLTFYELSNPLPNHYYFLPSKSTVNLSPSEWNAQLYTQLINLFNTFSPQIVIYEGCFVYSGLIQSMKHHPEASYIWLRPPSTSLTPDKREIYFDKVLALSPSLKEINELFKTLQIDF